MKKLYLVALGPSLNRDASISILMAKGHCGPWFYSIPNTFCIYSQYTANAIFEALHNPQDVTENLLITEIPTDNYMAWLPRQHCDYIRNNFVVHDYTLQFVGYWIDERREYMPVYSGVYCVYACSKRSDGSLDLLRLLYIGNAKNLNSELSHHAKRPLWFASAGAGNDICYSCAALDWRSLSVCESALIFQHKPVCNEANKESFLHQATRVRTSGANFLLMADFITQKTQAS